MASGVSPGALRAARERAGLTQHQLARMIGVAGGERVSRWELGAAEPRPHILVRVARALDLPVVDLMHIRGSGPDLRALRYGVGLSAGQMAARLHVSKSTYLRWEAGRWDRTPNIQLIQGLARVLKATTDTVVNAFEQARSSGS